MKIHDFKLKKQAQQKICMLTCYDYPSACLVSESNIDCVLVGDSVAMAVHGHPNTIMATIDMMVLHTQAVARGLSQQFLVTDLPFLCHKQSLAQTVAAVTRIMQAGAHAIKIEGGDDDTCNTIHHLVHAGVPVMGHIGLTPQAFHQLGGFKVQGRNMEQATALIQQAQKLEQSGCFAVVIECVPQHVSQSITKSLTIPTIGIGAGSHTDGQVLVWHDLLGLHKAFSPKFAKQYIKGGDLFLEAMNHYASQVKEHQFPTLDHAF